MRGERGRGKAAPKGFCSVMELKCICKGFAVDRRRPDAAPMLKERAETQSELLTYNSISNQRVRFKEAR